MEITKVVTSEKMKPWHIEMFPFISTFLSHRLHCHSLCCAIRPKIALHCTALHMCALHSAIKSNMSNKHQILMSVDKQQFTLHVTMHIEARADIRNYLDFFFLIIFLLNITTWKVIAVFWYLVSVLFFFSLEKKKINAIIFCAILFVK